MSAPVIFIHYGDSPYLRYTVKAAIRFNPDKTVYLLGDSHNRHYARYGVRHVEFKTYEVGTALEIFRRVFRLVAGALFEEVTYGRPWTEFNFAKWFVLSNFVDDHGYERFWTFDSDNLILAPLTPQETKFQEFDCTEHHQGMTMQGLISNRKVLRDYTLKINELFQRPEYLAEQERDFQQNPTFGFTMMRAYLTFKREARFRSIPIGTIIDGETFDEVLMLPQDMESLEQSFNGYTPKKIYLGPGGTVYFRHLPTRSFVRVNALDLSWAPVFLYERLFRHAARRAPTELFPPFAKPDSLVPMSWHEPLLAYLRRQAARFLRFARRGRRH